MPHSWIWLGKCCLSSVCRHRGAGKKVPYPLHFCILTDVLTHSCDLFRFSIVAVPSRMREHLQKDHRMSTASRPSCPSIVSSSSDDGDERTRPPTTNVSPVQRPPSSTPNLTTSTSFPPRRERNMPHLTPLLPSPNRPMPPKAVSPHPTRLLLHLNLQTSHPPNVTPSTHNTSPPASPVTQPSNIAPSSPGPAKTPRVICPHCHQLISNENSRRPDNVLTTLHHLARDLFSQVLCFHHYKLQILRFRHSLQRSVRNLSILLPESASENRFSRRGRISYL